MIYYEYTIKSSSTDNVWCNSPQNVELAHTSIDAFAKLGELAEQNYILFHTLSTNDKAGKNKNPDIQRKANKKMMQPSWSSIWRKHTPILAKKGFIEDPLWNYLPTQTPAKFALGMIQKYNRIIRYDETPSLQMLQLQNNFVDFIRSEIDELYKQVDTTWVKFNEQNILDGYCKKVINKKRETARIPCGIKRIINCVNALEVDYVDLNKKQINTNLAPVFA